MSEDQREESLRASSESSATEEDDDDIESPFDHPAFLPVILWGLSIWFGYDGWFNDDPDMQEHISFNRWGFGALVIAGIYFTIQAVREIREERERGDV